MPGSRRRRRRSSLHWLLPAVLLVAALGLGCWYVTDVLPYREAESFMPEEAELTIHQKPGGSLQLSWQPAERTDFYCIEVLRPLREGQKTQEAIFRGYAYDPSGYPLPGLPEDTELELRVSTVIEYGSVGKRERRQCENPAQAALTFNPPAVTELAWTADPEGVDITWQLQNATHCRIWISEENSEPRLLKTLGESRLRLTFGEAGDLPALNKGESVTLLFDACRLTEELALYGAQSGSITVTREDILGRELEPVLTDEGSNVCTITWNETKGEHYEIQRLDAKGQKWNTVAVVPRDEELRYTSGHLENLTEFRFRVAAVGGDTLPGERYAAVSSELVFETGLSPVFCTVWPVKDLDAYDAPEGGSPTGKVTQAKAYCVVDTAGDMLGVSIDGQICYIDGNYCMINLAEYLGELCAYDITNSYSSIYTVHGVGIPGVTGTVVEGYGAVAMSGGKYLVPLLLPTAKKVAEAARIAGDYGCRLKIYDTFRPNRATVRIYDLTAAQLDDPVPQGAPMTYRQLMTGGGWDLSNFLARGRSMHNFGVAVDLTLEALDSGQELPMQTAMHDLSHYSVPCGTNENGELLAKIMKGVGLTELISEWWHFQDNEAMENLELSAVWGGVNGECWMADDNGWRFRNRDGTYIKNTVQTIDGVTWRFDSNGYAAREE